MDEKTEQQNDQGTQPTEAQQPEQPESAEPRHEDLDAGEKAAEVKGGRRFRL